MARHAIAFTSVPEPPADLETPSVAPIRRTRTRQRDKTPPAWPRLLSRDLAAAYLSVSTKEIDRLLDVGALSRVRLPAARHRNNAAISENARRVLIDREELDALCTQNRERIR